MSVVRLPTRLRLVTSAERQSLTERQIAVRREYKPQAGFLIDQRQERLPNAPQRPGTRHA